MLLANGTRSCYIHPHKLRSASPFFEPWSDDVVVKLSNDWSGAYAKANVPIDGKPHSIKSLYGKSDLKKDDGIYATSVELIEFHKDTECIVVQDHPYVRAEIDAEKTWTFFDRGAWVNVDEGIMACRRH
ncbi:hypothetical protein BDV29DRAFT_181036 [Aspergillus leporis]|jgi:hypothetical protein|uniref:Uncharacterized protein n=1 Tax=Aspergillus leporis TaxID=41062 RepID=A0A5N5WP67_9EURO|nr:hypothetical protein BDV29DRAFT_181036 [Aspergillus leporis]